MTQTSHEPINIAYAGCCLVHVSCPTRWLVFVHLPRAQLPCLKLAARCLRVLQPCRCLLTALHHKTCSYPQEQLISKIHSTRPTSPATRCIAQGLRQSSHLVTNLHMLHPHPLPTLPAVHVPRTQPQLLAACGLNSKPIAATR
jgi:hypothetical protein